MHTWKPLPTPDTSGLQDSVLGTTVALVSCQASCSKPGLLALLNKYILLQQTPAPCAGAAAELRDLTGVWAAVRYLVAVGGTQTGLVKKHAGWILTVDPEAGLEMFTEMQPALPPDSVLPILAAHAPSLCASYLESAIAQGSVSAQVCCHFWYTDIYMLATMLSYHGHQFWHF